MNELSKHVSAYDGKSKFQFDNEIILNLYPRRILEKASARNSLLELGLGHGFSARAFEDKFDTHHIVEGSAELAEAFRRNFPGLTSTVFESMFEDFEAPVLYDVIVFGFVLEHVEDPLALLDHYRSFLSPEGQIFVAVPNMLSMNRRLGLLSGLLHDAGSLSAYDRELGHKRLYTVETLRETIETSGYDIKSLEGLFLKPLASEQLQSLDLPSEIISALCTLGFEYPELSLGLLAQARVR